LIGIVDLLRLAVLAAVAFNVTLDIRLNLFVLVFVYPDQLVVLDLSLINGLHFQFVNVVDMFVPLRFNLVVGPHKLIRLFGLRRHGTELHRPVPLQVGIGRLEVTQPAFHLLAASIRLLFGVSHYFFV